jgi:hypothetical protein
MHTRKYQSFKIDAFAGHAAGGGSLRRYSSLDRAAWSPKAILALSQIMLHSENVERRKCCM